MDRTRNRFGPYRTWITAGTPLLMISVAMIFMVKPGEGFAYLFAWLLVMYLGFSICTLAQLAWGAVLAPDYDQRSRLYGWWQSANILGVLLALAIPAVVLKAGLGDYVAGVHAMGWFIIGGLPLTLLLNLWVVPEPAPVLDRPKGGLAAYLALFARSSVRRILVCDLLLGLAPGLTGALLFYYFQYVKGFPPAQSQLFMVAYFVAGLVGAPFWSWLAARLGKHRALLFASLSFALLYAGVAFLPAGNFTVTLVGLFVAGLPYAAGLLLTRAMMADVADEVRLETGEDRMGLLFSLLSLTTKLGYAISVGALKLLDISGFKDKADFHNGPTAILTLQILFIVVPTALLLLAAWPLIGYPLGPARHAEIRTALALRDGAGKA
jgi:Na+/melibiose symporter-like transporter